jgi:glycosyltransferase involved in cell wall biosynthesis
VACLKRSGLFLKEIEALRIPIAEYKIHKLYNLNAFRQQLRFARNITRSGINIVHAYNFYANVFAIPAARLAGVPVIVASIRNNGDLCTPMQRRVQKFICRLAECILTNSEAIRQSLIAEGYNPEKITVIRNGIDLSRFGRQPNGSSLRREFGVPSHAPVVAMLSRFCPLKGIEYFLEAAAIVAGRFSEARFLLVGDRPIQKDGAIVGDVAYRRELESYAARLGLGRRAFFTGFRLDVPELLSEVTVSVLPSLSEGLSNVLLESMAAGVPIVATRVGGNPEVVEDGVTGLLVPARDPSALAKSICSLLEKPEVAQRFGQSGRQRVQKHFSLERTVKDTEELYVRLMSTC